MQSSSATHFSQRAFDRNEGSHRPFGFMQMFAAFAALSPLCAVSGLMLAQILGYVPY